MNRRDFLKILVASAAVKDLSTWTQHCPPEPEWYPETPKFAGFDPNGTYGNFATIIECPEECTEGLLNELAGFCKKQIAAVIPPPHRNRVEFIYKPCAALAGSTDPYDQYGTFGWKYSPRNPIVPDGKISINGKHYEKE